MKKIGLLLFIIFIALTKSFTQNVDFLKKYSYFCFTSPINSEVHTGTCFFYKKGANTYVITNYHVMRGMDPILGRKTFQSDSLVIVYHEDGSNFNKFIFVDLSKEKVSIFNHSQRIDLESHLVKLTSNFKINYINDLVDKDYLNVTPNKLIFYGFPADLQPQKIDTEKPVIDKVTGTYHNYFEEYKLNNLDNLTKTRIKQKEFEMTGIARKGFSGSPVFGEFYKNGKKIYKLMGVVFGSTKETNTSLCINFRSVYNFLPR